MTYDGTLLIATSDGKTRKLNVSKQNIVAMYARNNKLMLVDKDQELHYVNLYSNKLENFPDSPTYNAIKNWNIQIDTLPEAAW